MNKHFAHTFQLGRGGNATLFTLIVDVLFSAAHNQDQASQRHQGLQKIHCRQLKSYDI